MVGTDGKLPLVDPLVRYVPTDTSPPPNGRIPLVYRDHSGTWHYMGVRSVSVSGQVSIGYQVKPSLVAIDFVDGQSRWVWMVDDHPQVVGKYRLPLPVGGRDHALAYVAQYGVNGLETNHARMAARLKWRGAGALGASVRLQAWVVANARKSDDEEVKLADLLEVAEYVEPLDLLDSKTLPTFAEVVERLTRVESILDSLI